VETSALGSVGPPALTYQLALNKEVIQRGLLSNLQLETLLYAGQRHETILPGGMGRGGFFLADGAGMGKVLENERHGEREVVCTYPCGTGTLFLRQESERRVERRVERRGRETW
jgi:hypothetical protein